MYIESIKISINLSCVIIIYRFTRLAVGHKLFHLKGDTYRSFQWEKCGFRLHCPEGAVSKDTEVAVTAIAGGNFIVPKGTMLVSAVYAISVSKPLLQPLVIEMQHCVDLRYEVQTVVLNLWKLQ